MSLKGDIMDENRRRATETALTLLDEMLCRFEK
jgi:hypothetical protein